MDETKKINMYQQKNLKITYFADLVSGVWRFWHLDILLKSALSKFSIGSDDDALLIYGIGCHGTCSSWMKTYGFTGLHGRTLPGGAGSESIQS